MHNLAKSNTSTIAQTLESDSFIRDTWESASSAPTSALLVSTRERIEKSLLPFKRLNGTFKRLSQQRRLGNHREVKVLVSHGCNSGTKKNPYSSPIFAAACGGTDGQFKCAWIVVGSDADVNVVRSTNGKTPLHYAVEHEPYPKSTTGNTSLHFAVRRQDSWVVAMLLHKDTSVATMNNVGATALQITANQFRGELAPNHQQILELQLKAEKKRSADEGNGLIDFKAGVYERTSLHPAMSSKTMEAAEMLMSYGADLDALDATGKTPRIFARQNGFRIAGGKIIAAGT